MAPSHCVAGRCTGCGQSVWRTATAARDNGAIQANQEFILWPRPDSLYAVVETPTGHAPGIAFCRSCAPAPGEAALEGYGATLRLEGAKERYAAWYDAARETFYRSWLIDALSLEPQQVNDIIAEWHADRRG